MKFNFEATGVGSVPFKDPKEACEIIFNDFPLIPFWPQLSRASFLENMYVQYSEWLPGRILSESNKTIHITMQLFLREVEQVYNKYLEGDTDFFAISEKYAGGFYEFLNRLKSPPKSIKFVKGQIIGPTSYGLMLTDETQRSVIYNKDIFEILTKVLVMKARWQIRKLKKLHPKVIIFIDEPSLVSLGSSYVNIDAGAAFEKLGELIKAIKDEGALCGLHCCGNTDWPLLLKTDIDIISFDAYNFMKEFLLYGSELKRFFEKGGTVAWGIVPTSDAIAKETPESLARRLETALDILTDKGMEKGVTSSLVTPSCGVGTLDEKTAKKILQTAKLVSEIMQR